MTLTVVRPHGREKTAHIAAVKQVVELLELSTMSSTKQAKSVDDYLELPYTVEVSHDPEDGYFARVVELPGCMTWTDRIEDLWPMVEDAKRAWIEVSLRHGDDVPRPRSPAEAVALVRVPQELHRELQRRATRDGVTVDQFVAKTLARAVGE